MFVGHYAAALAAKAAEPKAPLWALVAGSQLVDWGWSALTLAGVEHFRMDPTLKGSPLDLYDMPWTHSLPGALVWSLAAGALARVVLRIPVRAAALIGAVVFSHWLLDLLVHRPDLALYPGGLKLGFGLWNFPVPEMIVEMGLLALAGAAWVGGRKSEGRHAWPAVLFLGVLVGLQYVSVAMPHDGPPSAMATTALVSYIAVALIAWWLDARPAPRGR